MGVVDTVTTSPANRPPIPTKSLSPPPVVRKSTPPSVVTTALGVIWIAAVDVLSLEGSWSVSSAATGEAVRSSISIDNNKTRIASPGSPS